MKSRKALIGLTLCFPLVCGAQEQNIIPLKSEPHHHLALHNDYINVYTVLVSPHDSVLLHRHDVDAIGVMMSNSLITVRTPGKPDVHQEVFGGQLRLQPHGLVHSTSIDGDTAYRNVTVELLSPQQGARNLCAAVMAAQPMNCPNTQRQPDDTDHLEEPQFQTDQTNVTLIRILPRRSVTLDTVSRPELIITLDEIDAIADENKQSKLLHSGDFLWRDPNSAAQVFKNDSDKEARFVTFAMKDNPMSDRRSAE